MDGVHPALELGWNLLPAAAAEELRSPGRHLAWSPGTLGCCGELVPTSPVLAIQCPLSAAVKLLLSPPHISEPEQQPHPGDQAACGRPQVSAAARHDDRRQRDGRPQHRPVQDHLQ